MIESAQRGSTFAASDAAPAAATVAAAAGTIPAPSTSRHWWQRSAVTRSADDDLLDDSVAANAWVPIALFALLVCAFLFRYAAASQLSSHVDEAASVMATQMVVDKGAPIFPSGTLYLQGATVSYILAPVMALGYGSYDDLLPLRLLSVFAGTLAVYFAYRLGRLVSGSAVAGFIVAVLLAVDPTSVRWSGMVRMYALLQCISLAMLWLFLGTLLHPPSRRHLGAMVALFWFGVFTHIGICLFLPGMAIAAGLTYGRDLRDRRRDLAIALIACAGAPFMMLGLNKLVAPPDESVSEALPGVSFVGDFLFSFDQILHPSFHSWELLFSYSTIGLIVPWLILGASCLLAGRHYLGEAGVSRFTVERKRMITALCFLYWLPIVAVAALATEPAERYLLHLHPLGFALVVLLAYDLIAHPFPSLQMAAFRRAKLATAGALAGDVQPWRPPRASAPRLVSEAGTGATRDQVRGLPSWVNARVLAIAGFSGVTLLAILVRMTRISHLSLWLDEGFTALYSRQAWTAVSGTNGFYSPHPPLYFTLVKVSDLFVSDQLAGRMISVIAGIATIPVFYKLISMVLDRRAAFVATLVLALSPIHLYYSQEARMYALVVFLIALSYLALVSYHFTPRWEWAAVYGLSAALALWVDYSSTYALTPQAVFILVQLYRHRRRAFPLFIAGVLAVCSYALWIPQVLASIDAANLVERRESYLGVNSSRVTTAMLSMMGIAGDGSYFQSFRQTLWNRYPDSRLVILLAVVPLVFIGAKALWRRWAAMLVVGGLLCTMLVGIWVSLISPGFAERTVLVTTLGWAALVGAAFSIRTSGFSTLIASGCLAVLLLVQTSTLDIIYNGAVKQRWTDATGDVALVEPLKIPVVTYSYGAVADTLVDVYHPDLFDRMRVITIRDGELEDVLSNGVIPEVGLTRTFDIPAGRLNEALPQTPENDLVWYLYYYREGEADVRAAIRRAGYTRVMNNLYQAPRYQVFLDLYARPGANFGENVPIDTTFASNQNGWVVPADGAVVSSGEDGTPQITITNQSLDGREASLLVDATGPTLMTFSADLLTRLPNDKVEVVISCLSPAGMELSVQTAEIPQPLGGTPVWNRVQTTALCPEGTSSVRLALQNQGFGDATFRNPTLQVIDVPAPG